ncbi:MAG: DNA-binding protein [Desulfobulbaceae bacterium]|nr:DNA-binding protein [Desulfobulbaceae bacterium]
MQQVATYETVVRACESLKSEGQKVTGRAVLAITGGSLGTVLGHIKEWRQNAAQTPANLPSEIPVELQAAILRALGFAQDEAAAKLNEAIEQASARESEALDGLNLAESRIEALTTELTEVRSQADKDRQEFEKVQAVLTEKIDSLTKRTQDLEIERKQLIETAEASRTETAKALLQIDRADQASSKAEARVQELESELKRILHEKIVAEKAQAVAEQRSTDQAETLEEIRRTLAELKTDSKSAIAEQKQEILDLKTEKAALEKQIAGLHAKKA